MEEIDDCEDIDSDDSSTDSSSLALGKAIKEVLPHTIARIEQCARNLRENSLHFLKLVVGVEEKCICRVSEEDMFPLDFTADFNRFRGEVGIDSGFNSMGVSHQRKHELIRAWTQELGAEYTDWLDQDMWFIYIYYKFMSWRISQLKFVKPKSSPSL